MDRDIRGMENESKGLGRQVEGKKDEVLGATLALARAASRVSPLAGS